MKIIPPKNQKYNIKSFEVQVTQDKAVEAAHQDFRAHYAKVREAQAILKKLENESEGLWQVVSTAQRFANLHRHDPNLPTLIV